MTFSYQQGGTHHLDIFSYALNSSKATLPGWNPVRSAQ
jgi:hypothetical protein